MNRRAFIASIPFLPSAAKAALEGTAEDLPFKCVIEMNAREYQLLSSAWTVRLDRVAPLFLWQLTPKEYHEMKLKKQLAMPAPNLP